MQRGCDDRRRVGLWISTLTAVIAGCGGGVYIGFGGGGELDDPPQVSLVASATSASAGQSLRLSAAASDDFGVDRVSFFRVESNGTTTALATDDSAPYQIDTAMPATSAFEVRYFARAVDGAGQMSDSAAIAVAVQR